MKIIQVEYSRLKTFGSYENEKVGAVAIVQEGENVSGVLKELKTWVMTELEVGEFKSKIRENIMSLRDDRDAIVREVMDLEDKAKRLTAFLKLHGVDLQQEIPF